MEVSDWLCAPANLGKGPQYLLNKKLSEPQSHSECGSKQKDSIPSSFGGNNDEPSLCSKTGNILNNKM
jgi:hypothetical protein